MSIAATYPSSFISDGRMGLSRLARAAEPSCMAIAEGVALDCVGCALGLAGRGISVRCWRSWLGVWLYVENWRAIWAEYDICSAELDVASGFAGSEWASALPAETGDGCGELASGFVVDLASNLSSGCVSCGVSSGSSSPSCRGTTNSLSSSPYKSTSFEFVNHLCTNLSYRRRDPSREL